MLKVLENAVPVACWSCSVAHNESTLFCPDCSKIQPPPGGDYFSVFGLDRRLNLDLAALEREFHRLCRRLHPDRFTRSTDNEKEWSLADTALLNDAYRTLKDPLRRTEYLLKLESSADNGPVPVQSQKIPADLLEEVFDFNMQLEEMRAAKSAGEDNPGLKKSLHRSGEKLAGMVATVDRDLRAAWDDWDAGDAAARSGAERAMVALLDRRRFLSNLVRDVNQILGA